jgi:exopolysaccharide biosynthesis polyprenyl glycosylphosphotransferase
VSTAVVPVAPEDVRALVDDRARAVLDRRRQIPDNQRRGWLMRRMLLASDLIGLGVAFAGAQLIAHGRFEGRLGTGTEAILFLASLPCWIVAAKIYGLYDRDEDRADYSTTDDLVGVFHLVTVGTWLIILLTYSTSLANPRMEKVAAFWVMAVVAVPLARIASRATCRRSVAYLQNTVIIGAGDVGQLAAKKLLRHPEYGINLVGFVDGAPKDREPGLEHIALLGDLSDLASIVDALDIERVIVAFSRSHHEDELEVIRALNGLRVQVDVVSRLFDVISTTAEMHSIEGLPLLGLPSLRLSRSSLLLKRTMDVIGAAIALIVFSPLIAASALAIKLDSPGPVFFRQVRVGANGSAFGIWKLRTMVVSAEDDKDLVRHLNQHLKPGGDSRMFKAPDDPRLTRVGRVLRRYSIDELPQLLNVLVGDMSLVGPRPLIPEEDSHVEAWARHRLDVRPGMTGLWQVLGRSDISFDEMVKLDYQYVTGRSLGGDMRLLFRTLPAVVARNWTH